MRGRDGNISQASRLSGQNGRINESQKKGKSFSLCSRGYFFFTFFFLNTSHFDSAAPSAERTRSSVLSLPSSIRVRRRSARRSLDTDHPSSDCCGHRRRAEPSPEGCAHGWEAGREGGGVVLHEVAGTTSQRRLFGSPVCQADESCAHQRAASVSAGKIVHRKKKKGRGKKMMLRHIPLLGGRRSVLLMVT